MDMKLISATCHQPGFAPHSVRTKERDIYKAEELKIDSSRSRLLQKTINDLWGSDSSL